MGTMVTSSSNASSNAVAASNLFFGIQISEKLNKTNYALWKAQVLTTIRDARLEGHINGKIVALAAEIEIKQGDNIIKQTNPEYEEWFARNQQVLGSSSHL
jgi:hypothetical protein